MLRENLSITQFGGHGDGVSVPVPYILLCRLAMCLLFWPWFQKYMGVQSTTGWWVTARVSECFHMASQEAEAGHRLLWSFSLSD